MGARKKWNVGGERKHVCEVKWKGCSPSDNTWEPLTNLVGFEGEIANINKKCEQAHVRQPINIARSSAKKKADKRAKKEQEELRVCKEKLKKDRDALSNEVSGAKEGTDASVLEGKRKKMQREIVSINRQIDLSDSSDEHDEHDEDDKDDEDDEKDVEVLDVDDDDDDDDDDNDSDADDDKDKKQPSKRLKKEDKKKDNKNTRQKRSPMWQCYDSDGRCTLPSAHDPSKPCGKKAPLGEALVVSGHM